MASVISGNSLGLYSNSLNLLGGANSLIGRSGQSDRTYLNSQTGNLVIQNQDEYVATLGLDLALVRTYNSQGVPGEFPFTPPPASETTRGNAVSTRIDRVGPEPVTWRY
jgi:hypothetical protein